MTQMIFALFAAPLAAYALAVAAGFARGLLAWFAAQRAEDLWARYSAAQLAAAHARARGDDAALAAAGKIIEETEARDAALLHHALSAGLAWGLAAPGALIRGAARPIARWRDKLAGAFAARDASLPSLILCAALAEAAIVEPGLHHLAPSPMRIAFLVAGIVLLELIAHLERNHRREWEWEQARE
jgi:hypothetical protein